MRQRAEKKGKYKLSKHEFYTAMHFALQYKDWQRELRTMSDTSKAITYSDMPKGNINPDPTGDLVEKRERLKDKVLLVERSARTAVYGDIMGRMCVPEVRDKIVLMLLRGVTEEGVTYDTLRVSGDMPCCRNVYNRMKRRFYYILNSEFK